LQISDKKKQIIVFSERGRSNEHPWWVWIQWSNGFGEHY
jgi:hypothetical protein